MHIDRAVHHPKFVLHLDNQGQDRDLWHGLGVISIARHEHGDGLRSGTRRCIPNEEPW